MASKTLKWLDRRFLYTRLSLRDRLSGRQLRKVIDRTGTIKAKDILLFCCVRNERKRMPAFVDYYEKLGVSHFVMVDNDSSDGLIEWAEKRDNITLFHTKASYRASNFGMFWLNDLLRRYGTGHWCVVVDPDEFLVYPFMETRSLRALGTFLEEEKRACMHAVMLDAYSDRAIKETHLEEGVSPFETCPYFDGDGYVQSSGWGKGTWIRGGPRLRSHFKSAPTMAPALNKIPFIFWESHYHYRMSMHDARPLSLNQAHPKNSVTVTGALFHFKMVSDLIDKATEEKKRRQHYAGGREYDRYRKEQDLVLYEEGISVPFRGSRQLLGLGLMSPGRWF